MSTPARPSPDDHEAVSPRYSHRLTAQDSDIDALGHVSNIRYLAWVQDAATAHSQAVGWDFDRFRALNLMFVVRKHEITYYAPVYVGDELVCETWVAGWRGASSPRRTEIRRESDGQKIASCTTLWALIDWESGRPRRLTQEMRDAFAQEV